MVNAVTPRWWAKTADNGHDVYQEGDEYVCTKCGRRWDTGDTDIPECDARHSKVTPYGLKSIRNLKQQLKESKS